ncbi:MAG: SagB/ThcOx family dehydrogenase [Dysgonamonadaceae bacterium]|jgi:SagB-type dehydrogenase family enzyme|nr:SagB/ThcOx family dehydrogenase [Dysgonamonadaceae bacterium]
MKRSILLFSLTVLSFSFFAQDIKLPAPQKEGGMPLMEALSLRQTTREFSSKGLYPQTLSNLLWAAYGFNREDKRVVPSANNRQSFDVYVILEKGVYLYDAKENTLILKKEGDFRSSAGRQDFVAIAPVNLIYVADLRKTSSRDMAFADCGFISQNVYLFCASERLGTVVRGWFDKDELHQLLNLTEQQEVILTQTVGYNP